MKIKYAKTKKLTTYWLSTKEILESILQQEENEIFKEGEKTNKVIVNEEIIKCIGSSNKYQRFQGGIKI